MLPGLLALFAVPFVLIERVITGIVEGGAWIVNQLLMRRVARLRAERDAVEREQDELRRTILGLAEQLGANAHEARKALIRESYLATGRTSDQS